MCVRGIEFTSVSTICLLEFRTVLFWFSFSYWTLIDNKSLDFWKPLLIGRSIHDFFVFLILCLFLTLLIVTKYSHLRFQGIFSLSLRYFLFFTTIWYLDIFYLYHRQFFYRNDYISIAMGVLYKTWTAYHSWASGYTPWFFIVGIMLFIVLVFHSDVYFWQ
jgi:hypothetical protein